MSGKLKHKVFLITGATSGMGKATALRFLEEGAKIVAVGRREDALELYRKYETAVPLKADVTKKEDVIRMADLVSKRFGRLDGVCNIAGVNDLSYPILDTEDERWERVIDTDLTAPFRIIRQTLPLMIESGGGSIVNIGSYAALRGNHGPAYTAAKAGLAGLTKSVAFRHAKDHIRCNIVHPGGTATNIGQTSGGTYHSAQKELSKIVQSMPVNYYGQPEEIAHICVFLCSEEAAWINGAEISVDGGMSVC